MTDRSKLLKVHVELTAHLRASDTWEKSYKADKDTFKRLVREEAELQASALGYFLGLAERARELVDWSDSEVTKLMASAVPGKNSELWKREQQLLTNAIHQNVLNLMVIGGQAGESIYNRPIGLNTLTDYILDAADNHTAQLVSGVTDTTRGYIQTAIRQTIDRGEDSSWALARIQELIASPVRAEMIAQTESVNAYQIGLKNFANQTGAVSKTWDALSGACDYCAPMDGVEVDIDQDFEFEDGSEIDSAPAHPRCRCGLIYNYPK